MKPINNSTRRTAQQPPPKPAPAKPGAAGGRGKQRAAVPVK